MRLAGSAATTIQRCGIAWIALSPVIWFFAVIAKTDSATEYRIQLWAFSLVATFGFISGAFGLFRYRWAGRGLVIASLVVAVYFFAAGALFLIDPFILASGKGGFASWELGLAFMTALCGLPFWLMADNAKRALRRAQQAD